MIDIGDEKVWQSILEHDSKLKELALKAGLENNPKRVKELENALVFGIGREVIKTEAENNLAIYLFSCDFEGDTFDKVIEGRTTAAESAGIRDWW